MVLGLDLAYGKQSKLAKAYIWRSKLTTVNDDGRLSNELSSQLVYEHVSNYPPFFEGRPLLIVAAVSR